MTNGNKTNAMADELRHDDCWNRIGIWSKSGASCPRLAEAVHCRNCEVYSAAARVLLDRPLSSEARQQWAAEYDRPSAPRRPTGTAFTVFRIGAEWLAIPTLAVNRVGVLVPVRRIPHRHHPVLRGLANLASELALVVSLAVLLGIADEPATPSPDQPRGGKPIPRLLWVVGDSGAFAFEVAEVSGIHRFEEQRIERVPSTLEQAVQRYVLGTCELAGRRVGILDFDLVAYGVEQALK